MSTVPSGHVGALPCVPTARRGRVLRAAFVAVAFLVPATAAAQIYYVDQSSASCSNTGPGTEAQPYCTITSAINARGAPGVTIRVKPGTYREQVTVNTSGAAGSPLVIEAVGSGVVVDGADSFSTPADWVLLSGNVYRAAGVTWAPLQVFKNGARLTPSTSAPAGLPPNSFTWVSGEGLYVNVGGGNPGSQQLLVGQRTHGFNLNTRSWVTIAGFVVRNTEDRGFNLGTGCTNVVLSSNDVSFANGYGIRISGCTNITVQNNRVSKGNYHGIGLLASSTGCILRGNESFENADPTVSRANGIYLYASSSNTVSANRTHHNQDSGILFTGGSNDNVSVNNMSYANGDHGIDHLASTGTIHGNDVVFGNYRDGFSIEGSASNTQLHNCIAVENGLTTGRYNLWVDGTSPGFVSDYNIIWNSTGQDPFKYISTPYATIAAYRAASGQDAHSLQSNPRFANGGSGDFRLLSNSPAIDAANSGAPNWPSTDAIGRARVNTIGVPNTGAGPILFGDRGAFEFAGDQPPVVSAPATASVAENGLLTVNITASDPDNQVITSLTASGLPSGATFTAGAGNTSGTLSWTPNYTQAGAYSITFTATNALSGSSTTQVTVSNTDRAPVVTAPASASVAEASLLTVNVSASDPDAQAITSLTASGLPAGATFTPGAGNATGTLTWTPGYTQSGTYNITFTATNSRSGSATTQVIVTNTNGPPVVVAPPTATIPEDSRLTFEVTASDPDGTSINSLTASGLPAGATFTKNGANTTGTFTWTPNFNQAGTYTVIFTASNSLTGRDTTVITVTNTDRAPVVTAPATKTGPENSQLTISITASDPDAEPITSLTASGLPTGATFMAGAGNATGTVSWTPDFTQSGSYSITFIATNTLSDTASTAVTITNLDRIPSVTAPPTATVAEGAELIVSVTVSDPDLDPVTSLTAAGLPAGATFTPGAGNTTGLLRWTPDFSQAGSYNIIFTASNALSGAATTQVTVTNVDRAPVVTAPSTVTVARNDLLTIQVTAFDPDAQAITSLTASGLPAGATFIPGAENTTGTLSWTPAFTESGTHTVSFTASNQLSGSATTQITISGGDRAPMVTAPATMSVAENEPLTLDITAVDPDGEPIASLTAADLPAGATFTAGPGNASGTLAWTPDFTQSGSYAVTFTATNALSGSATTQVTVTGSDRAPVLSVPATASGAENALLTVTITAQDPDGEPITSLTAADLPPGATFTPSAENTIGTLSWTPNFSQSGGYTVSFTAANALSDSAVTQITIIGTDRPPMVSAPDTVIFVEGQANKMIVTAVDLDGQAIVLWTVTGLPAGATFKRSHDNTVGTLSWTPSLAPAGPMVVIFTAQSTTSSSDTTVVFVAPAVAGVEDGDALRSAPRVLPNPMRGSGQLRFGTSREGAVRVDIFDLSGRMIGTPVNEAHARAGEFVIPIGSPNGGTGSLSPGLYFYRVRTPDGTSRGRFMVRR